MFLQVIIFSGLAILIGLSFVFFGYRFFRILLPIWAFFTGLFMGVAAIAALMGGGFLSTSLGLIVGFFIGLALALVAYFAYSFAVVLFGATLGFAIGQGFLQLLGLDGFLSFLSGIFLAVVFAAGFVFLRMPRLIIIVATAFGGAMAVITGVFVLFGQLPPEATSYGFAKVMVGNSFLWTLVWVVLALIGIAAQYATEKELALMEPYNWDEEFNKPLTMDEVKKELSMESSTTKKETPKK